MNGSRIGVGRRSRVGMFEYRNLDWDTSTDAGVDPVVINTWYTPLATTRNVKAYYLMVEQTNTGATDETIAVELTVNGVVYNYSTSIASGSTWYAYFYVSDGGLYLRNYMSQLLSMDADQSAPLETRSLQVRVRQTTAVDAVSAIIEVNMTYATLEVT